MQKPESRIQKEGSVPPKALDLSWSMRRDAKKIDNQVFLEFGT